MYDINLIHEKIVPINQQRTRMGIAAFYVLIWLVTGVVGAYYVSITKAEIDSYRSAAKRLETRNALPSGLTKDDVVALGKQLQTSQGVLASIKGQSIQWATKLHQARIHLANDTWLNRLYCRQSTSHFSGPNKEASKPLGEFVVEGMMIIPSGAVGTISLDDYVNKLKSDTVFMTQIKSLKHLVVGRERFGPNEVATFVIVCVIQEGVRFDA